MVMFDFTGSVVTLHVVYQRHLHSDWLFIFHRVHVYHVVSRWTVVFKVHGAESTPPHQGEVIIIIIQSNRLLNGCDNVECWIGVFGDPHLIPVDLLFPGVPAGLCEALRSGGRFADHCLWHPLLLNRHLLGEQTTMVYVSIAYVSHFEVQTPSLKLVKRGSCLD